MFLLFSAVQGCYANAHPLLPGVATADQAAAKSESESAVSSASDQRAGSSAHQLKRVEPPPSSAEPKPEQWIAACQAAAPDPHCAQYAEIDTWLQAGDARRAKKQLVALANGTSLQQQAVPTAQTPQTDLESWHQLLVGRTLLFLGSLSFGQGDEHSRAASNLFAALDKTTIPELFRHRLQLDRTRALLATGDGPGAAEVARGLVERHPNDAEAQASLGIALLSVGQVKQSLGPLERSLRLDPDEPERPLVVGTAHMLLGDLDGAERNFRTALAIASRGELEPARRDDVLARIYGNLGAVLLVRGQAKDGRAYFERALNFKPGQATYLANLAYASLLLDDLDAAEAAAKRSIQSDPGLVSAWINLGLVQAQRKNYAQARSSFSRAHDLDPTDPRPTRNLADLDELLAEDEAQAGSPSTGAVH